MPLDVEFWRAALWDPLMRVPWSDWRGLWLGSFAGHRNAVLYFLPLLVVLLMLPQRRLRVGIIATGVVFIGYVFGPLYLVLWLATCWIFHAIGEWYARIVPRLHAAPWWQRYAPLAVIVVHFLVIRAIGGITLSPEQNAWLLSRLRWLCPMGARGLAWEPPWFVGPRYPFFGTLLGRAHDIGAAYLTMRMVTYFSELRRGTIPRERRRLSSFLAYLCYVPTLIQGPLERYAEFQEQLDTSSTRRSWSGIAAGLARLLLGAAKCLVYIIYLYPAMVRWQIADFPRPVLYENPEQIESYGLLFFAVHVQVLAVYLAFSGYCDMVIGMSRLLGYRVVENFQRPWAARSLTDMWRRWHISLSFILRDYIFFPLTRRRWNPTLTLLLTFFVCGVWHDFSGPYAVWGLLMGVLVALNQRWARWMRDLDRHPRRPAAAVRRTWLRLQPLPKLCAWLLTINVFVMTGWVCLGGVGAVRVAWELIRRPLNALLGSWGLHLPPM